MENNWTIKENVLNEEKKYTSRTDFKNKSNGAYCAAHRYGWFDEIYWLKNKNIKGSEHKKRRWKTKKDVIEESKKYNNRTDFRKKSRQAYEIANKNKWLDDMVWLNTKNVYLDKVDTIYKYFFPTKNAIYVGRTIHKELRDYQHRTVTNDSVFDFATKNSLEIPQMEIIETNLTVLEGSSREKYWEKYYKDNGYSIINKRPCGGIGSMAKGKWSKKKCFEESKKYNTRTDFFTNSNSAYQKSLKEGWLDEMTWLSNTHKYPRGYWRKKENVMSESKKYSSKIDFQNNNTSAYQSALKCGWIKEMHWLVKQAQKPFGFWKNKENVINESKKYDNITDFRKNSITAYQAAKKEGYLNELIWLKNTKCYSKKKIKNSKHLKGYWKNRENIMAEARKYSTKEEFKKGNLTAFLAAYKYGYIDEMYWLVKKKQHKWGHWTYENIEKEAIKYNTKTEFFKGNQTAYRAALKLGIIDDFFLNDYIQY